MWGIALVALVAAGIALGFVWLSGDLVRTSHVEEKKTASIWILTGLTCSIVLNLLASRVGAWTTIGIVFRRNAGNASRDREATASVSRDSRLTDLRAELRGQFGWRWKYRQPWLVVTGQDTLTETVAPGLRRTGFMLTENAVLLHAAPENVDGKAWRDQISRMRPRRPADAMVQVLRATDVTTIDPELARTLATQAIDLRWAAPVYLLHSVQVTGKQPEAFEAVGMALKDAPGFSSGLDTVMRASAHRGALALRGPERIRYLAQISEYMDHQSARILAQFDALVASKWRRASLAGMMFVPVYPTPPGSDFNKTALLHASVSPTWRFLADAARSGKGKRVGFYWSNAVLAAVAAATMMWCVALVISFIGNRDIALSASMVAKRALAAAAGSSEAIRTQLEFQQTIETLEANGQHGAPWYLRAGLNSNEAILSKLWPLYQTVSARNLRDPVARSLQSTLAMLSELRSDSPQDPKAMQRYYNALKAYLMLAEPRRTDAAFLSQELLKGWRQPTDMPVGEWLDKSPRLASFYANHLATHPEWRTLINDVSHDSTIGGARNALINQIGLQTADDALYKSLMDEAKGKYSDATLATLLNGADARGLFGTAQSVPGIYTRAAWDGFIAESIDKVSRERNTGGDWVLSEINTKTDPAREAKVDSQESIKQRLTARYFVDYAAAWQGFLNSVRWQSSTNLSGTIDQLSRLADAQQSPLIALMKSVQYQAQAGRPSQALSETLVRKARDLLHGGAASSGDQSLPPNPLDSAFGPLLAMMGDVTDDRGATRTPAAPNDVGLAHYLNRVTAVRLKLQQIASSPEPQAMARTLAQAIFQGKLSELMQARDDANITAASLGVHWAGFGNALFARPLDAAWQTILTPAGAGLNDLWRTSVATPFKTAFDGRYPFAETPADASFVELGRYIRPDTGLISRFVTSQLAGVLQQSGDRWTPSELAPQALQFDPAFIKALAQLSAIGARLYAQGDAGYRFELMALPTVDVTRTELNIDGVSILYFNQRETWKALQWPGNGLNGRAILTWQTFDAGTRIAFESTGDWAFLRLLEKAEASSLDSTRTALTWTYGDKEPLHYVIRTQAGTGPLDLLKLRGFKMPERIFTVGTNASKTVAGTMLPPLPPELQP
ncbi:putative membrane protein [Caballeronia sordidicola]|uniref:Putative membrane protein n=1 Tax=Caballeronia sordidicola TaxID=196367 RepID=A0A242N167_CABSO|nr:putative membrane protein [Caballeronia sordidicola]